MDIPTLSPPPRAVARSIPTRIARWFALALLVGATLMIPIVVFSISS